MSERMTLQGVAVILREIAAFAGDDAAEPYQADFLLSVARWLEDYDCACGGREPIWEGMGVVGTVAGNAAYLDTGSIKIRGENLKVGDLLEVYAFLPAKKEATHA